MPRRVLLGFFFFFQAQNAFATSYFGRIMLGDYLDTESFKQPLVDGTNTNDDTILSTRFFLNAYQIGSHNLEGTIDVRDKNDFFDKLDSENLKLTPSNQFQAYQLNLRLDPTDPGMYWTAGRFNVPEAGGEFADGTQIGYRWNRDWRSALFGGLLPKTQDQTYASFNSNSDVFGTYSLFQPVGNSWLNDTYWTNALVGEQVQGHLDRFYLYENVIYKWSASGQIVALAYLDFVPNIYIQTGLVSLNQNLNQFWSTQASLTSIDVVEYSRREGVLETLPSSPYREASLNFRRDLGKAAFWDTMFIYGLRQSDGLRKEEVLTGPSFFRLWDDHFTAKTQIGGGKDFISNDVFTQESVGYFTSDWEYDLSVNYTLSADNYGITYHKWYNQLSVARYFSRDFFVNLALEQANDEQVSIWSGYIKLSYLFGKRTTAPIRDAAPPPAPPLPAGRL